MTFRRKLQSQNNCMNKRILGCVFQRQVHGRISCAVTVIWLTDWILYSFTTISVFIFVLFFFSWQCNFCQSVDLSVSRSRLKISYYYMVYLTLLMLLSWLHTLLVKPQTESSIMFSLCSRVQLQMMKLTTSNSIRSNYSIGVGAKFK